MKKSVIQLIPGQWLFLQAGGSKQEEEETN